MSKYFLNLWKTLTVYIFIKNAWEGGGSWVLMLLMRLELDEDGGLISEDWVYN